MATKKFRKSQNEDPYFHLPYSVSYSKLWKKRPARPRQQHRRGPAGTPGPIEHLYPEHWGWTYPKGLSLLSVYNLQLVDRVSFAGKTFTTIGGGSAPVNPCWRPSWDSGRAFPGNRILFRGSRQTTRTRTYEHANRRRHVVFLQFYRISCSFLGR